MFKNHKATFAWCNHGFIEEQATNSSVGGCGTMASAGARALQVLVCQGSLGMTRSHIIYWIRQGISGILVCIHNIRTLIFQKDGMVPQNLSLSCIRPYSVTGRVTSDVHSFKLPGMYNAFTFLFHQHCSWSEHCMDMVVSRCKSMHCRQ